MTHTPRRRPEGRHQCTQCRAAWADAASASRSASPCPGVPLAHGHPYSREHVVYPASWASRAGNCREWECTERDCPGWHGPDSRLCDDYGCGRCVGHNCDCDACTGKVDAPGLRVLLDM